MAGRGKLGGEDMAVGEVAGLSATDEGAERAQSALAAADAAVAGGAEIDPEASYTMDFVAVRSEPVTVERLLDWGYVGSHEAKDFRCVLGRGAVDATQKCLGVDCMAWREGPRAEDAGHREYGFCGLVGRPRAMTTIRPRTSTCCGTSTSY